MPKYKFRNFYKTLLQIWLFYYFVNAIKVHECREINDVEFIESTKNDELDVSDRNVDSEFMYEPIVPNQNEFMNAFDENFDDRKNVNLNVNNKIEHDNDQQAEEVPSKFTEINEQKISGEKILYLSESPFLLRQDLEIEQNAKLTVEPGVTIHFAPMVGITVHGQILAIVSIPKHYNEVSHSYESACCYLITTDTDKKFVYTTASVNFST